MNKKELYEAPVCEVLEVKMEAVFLQSSPNSVSATRSGYGTAIDETWE
jgi:hypothetical protein